MMPNIHKNQRCGYEELLVSYLYGETAAAESTRFEAHLVACPSCADELAAFAGVKFSISEWKLEEFDAMASPAIELPCEVSPAVPEKAPANRLWLSKLGNLLPLTPAWTMPAAAAATVIAVFVGIAFFAMNFEPVGEFAKTADDSKIAATPTTGKTPGAANSNTVRDVRPEQNVPDGRRNKAIEPPPFADEKRPSVRKNDKAVENLRPAPKKSATAETPKNDRLKRNPGTIDESAPKIVEDEDVDDTLRLAELFEEIDTVE